MIVINESVIINETIKKDTRGIGKYKKWKKQVHERDHNKCVLCDITEKEMNAHHPIPYSIDESKRYDIINGITLCPTCHSIIHCKKLEGATDKIQEPFYCEKITNKYTIWCKNNNHECILDIPVKQGEIR